MVLLVLDKPSGRYGPVGFALKMLEHQGCLTFLSDLREASDG